MKQKLMGAAALLALAALSGCGGGAPVNQPMSMAPPVSGQPVGQVYGGQPQPQSQGVYQWQDVPQGQQVPVNRAVFDQGGYQIYAATGETILVPFQNQNLYVMKFGRSQNGQTYFVNDGNAPVLYLGQGAYVENSAAQGARWYPIPDSFQYQRPMYVGIAPSWNDYVGMGWYPGMTAYGGMWGYGPHASFAWMPGFSILIGSQHYYGYRSYHNYYVSHPGYTRVRTVYNYSSPRSSGRSFGHNSGTGSFGSGSFGTRRSTGSFGSGSFGTRSTTSRPTGSFGSGASASRPAWGRTPTATSSGGSFGGRRGFGSTSGTASPPRSSFGSSGASGGSFSGGSFGSSRPSSGGSFGSSRPSSGGSFGSSRSSGGGSFGSSRSSGGGSFGGSSRSSGGSFGSSRRR